MTTPKRASTVEIHLDIEPPPPPRKTMLPLALGGVALALVAAITTLFVLPRAEAPFELEVVGVEEVEPLSAAVAALDAYCEGFTRAYGTESPIDPKIATTRAELQLRLDAAIAARGPQQQRPSDRPKNPAPATSGPSRGARDGMTIAGGALLGLGVGAAVLATLGAVRGRTLEARFDDPANHCPLAQPQGLCADLYRDGKHSNGLAIAGAVLAPLLLGGGAALLVLGLRRRDRSRPDARHALTPALAPGFVGLRLGGRF